MHGRTATYRSRGANGSAVADVGPYLADSKKCFGIIRAALCLLKSVYGRPHNPNEDLIHSDLVPVFSFAYGDIDGFRGRKLRRNNARLLRAGVLPGHNRSLPTTRSLFSLHSPWSFRDVCSRLTGTTRLDK